MAQGPLGLALQHIRRLAGRPQEAGVSDGQLLRRFASRQEEPAFAELWLVTARWCSASAAECCTTSTPPRTPSRRRF